MSIRLLGGFTVRAGDATTDRLRTRKTEALLAFLAVRPGERRSREELADRFWPEDPPEVARQKLRLALNSIRGVVGEALESDRLTVRLVGVETDLGEVRRALADKAPSEARLAILDDIDPTVMPGHTDPEVESLRREVAVEIAEGWRIRARLAMERHDLSATVRALGQVLDLEPFGLSDHRALVSALRKSRRSAAARAHLERMRTLFGTLPPEFEVSADSPSETPLPSGPFVGREREIGALSSHLLGDAEPVLLTLTGPGGVGKTRLAQAMLAAAADAEVETRWVSLADAEDASDLAARIGRALGAEGDLEEAASSAPSTLLVLDNLEQIPNADVRRVLDRLLPAPSALRVLATSQRPVDHPAENVFELSPLAVPAGDGRAQVAASGSGRLFAARAGNLGSLKGLDESAAARIARICRRLEGLPLGIELAASWTDILGLEELDDQLAGALPDLEARRTDRPERHRSLRAAVVWGLSRLPPALREAHARLSVLPASFDLAAAGAVAGLEPRGLGELVLRSLVAKEAIEAGTPRFRLLEPIRRVAQEELSVTAREAALDRLADHFEARISAELDHDRTGLAPGHEADLANFELALDRLRAKGEALRAAGAAARMYLLWYRLGHPESGEGRLRAIFDSLPDDAFPARASVANSLGAIGYFVGDTGMAAEWFAVRLAMLEALGDPMEIASAQMNVGIALQMAGRYGEAAERMEAAAPMLLAHGSPRRRATALLNLSSIRMAVGDRQGADGANWQVLDVCGDGGLDNLAGLAWFNLGEYAWLSDESAQAEAYLGRAAEFFDRISETLHSVETTIVLAICAFERGSEDEGKERLERALASLAKVSGSRTWRFVAEAGLLAAESANRPDLAAEMAGASERLSTGLMRPLPQLEARFQSHHARVAARLGEPAAQAHRAIGARLSRRELRERLDALVRR